MKNGEKERKNYIW